MPAVDLRVRFGWPRRLDVLSMTETGRGVVGSVERFEVMPANAVVGRRRTMAERSEGVRLSDGTSIGRVLSLAVLFLDVAEDVVKDEVAVGLRGEEEGLSEFAPFSTSIGEFAQDLNDDAAFGAGLTVDVGDVDLAIFKA